jgi:excisionase family DNA binding protein
MTKLEDLVTQKEAAEMRGVSIQAIDYLIRAGRLRTVKFGGKRFLYRKEVEAYRPGKPGPKATKRTKLRSPNRRRKSQG